MEINQFLICMCILQFLERTCVQKVLLNQIIQNTGHTKFELITEHRSSKMAYIRIVIFRFCVVIFRFCVVLFRFRVVINKFNGHYVGSLTHKLRSDKKNRYSLHNITVQPPQHYLIASTTLPYSLCNKPATSAR